MNDVSTWWDLPGSEGRSGAWGTGGRPRVLFVCTGNICRSVFAARYLASLPVAQKLAISSAGTYAVVGHGIDETVASCASGAGLNLAGHRARQLTGRVLHEADLIVIFGPEHREWIFRNCPEVLDRVVPLARAGAVLSSLGRHRLVMWDSIGELVRDSELKPSEADWVADPYRQDVDTALAAVRTIGDNVDILANRVEWTRRRRGRHAL